jgi:hypothetical protein
MKNADFRIERVAFASHDELHICCLHCSLCEWYRLSFLPVLDAWRQYAAAVRFLLRHRACGVKRIAERMEVFTKR